MERQESAAAECPLPRVLIVGGGTAGWMAAAMLKTHIPALQITLVESASIGRVGVGEATVPTLKGVLEEIGVDERQFMHRTGATLKQGVRFDGWGGDGHSYYHTFESFDRGNSLDAAHAWLAADPAQRAPYAYAAGVQATLCDLQRSPKRSADAGYRSPLPYAYHLDAEELGDLLREVAVARGVRRIADDVMSVQLTETGTVASVTLREQGQLSADLFIDCSGFRSIIIEKALGAGFESFANHLLCDRAVAIQVPHEQDYDGVNVFTRSKAVSAGWIWEIGLKKRRGIGYVYSSAFTSPHEAEEELRLAMDLPDQLGARHLEMRVGKRPTPWVGNCVAVGLSAGFIEPLESTGIWFIEHGVRMLLKYFPYHGRSEHLSNRYNEELSKRYDEVREFIVLHYSNSTRSDSDFWREVVKEERIPDSLKEKMLLWQDRPPSEEDFNEASRIFGAGSYRSVLYGLGRVSEDLTRTARLLSRNAERTADKIKNGQKRAADDLPAHLAWLRNNVRPEMLGRQVA